MFNFPLAHLGTNGDAAAARDHLNTLRAVQDLRTNDGELLETFSVIAAEAGKATGWPTRNRSEEKRFPRWWTDKHAPEEQDETKEKTGRPSSRMDVVI